MNQVNSKQIFRELYICINEINYEKFNVLFNNNNNILKFKLKGTLLYKCIDNILCATEGKIYNKHIVISNIEDIMISNNKHVMMSINEHIMIWIKFINCMIK